MLLLREAPRSPRARSLGLGALIGLVLPVLLVPAAIAAGSEFDLTMEVTRLDRDSGQAWLDLSLTWQTPPVSAVALVAVPLRCPNPAQVRDTGAGTVIALTGPTNNPYGTLIEVTWKSPPTTGSTTLRVAQCVAPLSSEGGVNLDSSFVALDDASIRLGTSSVGALLVRGDVVAFSEPAGTKVDSRSVRLDQGQLAGAREVRIVVSSGLESGGWPLILTGILVAGVTAAYSFFQRSEAVFSPLKLVVASLLLASVVALMVFGWQSLALLRNFGVVSIAAVGVGHSVAMVIAQTMRWRQSRASTINEKYSTAGGSDSDAVPSSPPTDPPAPDSDNGYAPDSIAGRTEEPGH